MKNKTSLNKEFVFNLAQIKVNSSIYNADRNW